MPEIRITHLAKSDLLEIWSYIAEDSMSAADKFLDTIEQKCRLISHAPKVGRLRDELAPDVRSFPADRYIIYYRPSDQGIEVIRVLSASRDIDALWVEPE